MSETTPTFQEADFRRCVAQLVSDQQNSRLGEMDIGRVLLAVNSAAAEAGLFVPPELSLLGKTLLQLDQVGRILAPEFDPNESIRRNASAVLNQRLKNVFTEGKLFSTLLEAKQFLGALPLRLNRILDALGKTEVNVNVRATETKFLLESAQKVANRITTGLILAALIVGAALLMQVPTRFQLFGYPGLAIICFLAAAAGGTALVLNILWQDHKRQERKRR
jgi:predicted unusual protein kinase regulating ubiquinone biosynthesis (AarF/ABC1/UbiB family)